MQSKRLSYITKYKSRKKRQNKPKNKKLSKFKCLKLEFKKGTPAQIKAAIAYNFMLDIHDPNGVFERIKDGAKIKWVYTNVSNPYAIEAIAFKGYDDPEFILDFINQYIDYDKNFKSNLINKLQKFYDALSFGMIPQKNQNQIENTKKVNF
jgi:hypothetical protein